MLPDFVDKRLKPFASGLPPEWTLWQHKTLNIHRGVIHRDATAAPTTLGAVRDEVRRVVKEKYRPAWWRGFGFGAVVSLAHPDDSFDRLPDLIDVRNNGRGTWQWVVLHYPDIRTAVGVCTWTEGYLAPVYRDLLDELESDGYEVHAHQKEMDAVMRTLLTVRDRLRQVKRVLGLGLGGLDSLGE